tara:strand:+ start:46 stop:162 length:117 start_codon:yes stop_codon:yes gene_type:complete
MTILKKDNEDNKIVSSSKNKIVYITPSGIKITRIKKDK